MNLKPHLLITVLAFTIPSTVTAQWAETNFQSADLAKLGIVRMATQKTTLHPHKPDKVTITETFFDTLGRIPRIVNEACSNCGTVQEFDSLSGLVAYVRVNTENSFRESFLGYDDNKRRVFAETCGSGNYDDCVFYCFEYDEENTERMYQSIQKKSIKRNNTKESEHVLGLFSANEEKRLLLQESFFNPEGILEETKKYENGKFKSSLLYEYDQEGRMIRTWHFDGKIKQLYNETERNEVGKLVTRKTYTISTGDPLHVLSEPSIQTYEYDENGLLIKTVSKRVTTAYIYFTE